MKNKRDALASLSFFRTLPDNILETSPLLSSFQSFETSLFLIAMGRYPSALVNCINAWESAIKAGMKISRNDRNWTLEDLLTKAVESYPALERHSLFSVTEARRLRNDLVHFGASPDDDSRSLGSLLSVGFPFLFSLYREIFGIYFDWRLERPGVAEFIDLVGDSESHRFVLLSEISELVCNACGNYNIYARAIKEVRPSLFVVRLQEHLRAGMKRAFLLRGEIEAIESWEALGATLDAVNERKTQIQKRLELAAPGAIVWSFSCPVCEEYDCFVCEVDEPRLKKDHVWIVDGMCARCDFLVISNESGILNNLWAGRFNEESLNIKSEVGLA